jgi:3-oxoacyl-(acyl-carrier-protein) synthase/acyl carrier protein
MEKIADNILKKFQEGKIDRETAAEMLQVVRSQSVGRHDIAVIGMQVDLPGANTLADFWELVVNGANMIHPFPKGRKKGVQWMLSEVQRDFEFKDGSYLNDIEAFDYAYFGISPKEARLMNPSQRVFLQTVIRAIDDAGYGGTKIRNTNTGVFVGYGSDRIVDYKDLIAKTEPEEFATAFTGNLSSIVAGRVSHFLGLNGPAMVMDTTCSSSLVAIDSAVGALQRGQCEMAIAGGVKINIFPLEDGLDEGIDIMSSDGKTYAFDHRAGGTGLGEGSCAVLLKPLADAERDGDHIYAVIKGSAVNHDGHSSGITVPNVKAQEMVLKNAWKAAGIHPEQLVHIEAHGTGTNLGDPIEVEALSRAFKPYTTHKQFCSIASGKANWGHLDNAAGIFSFIKSVLAVKHGIIPPAINFEAPNPHIDFCDSPMYVNELPHILESESRERSYFGVSAFGLSGTNCHVVLGAAPQQIEIPTADRLAVRLLPVSGTDFQAVKRQAQSLHLFLLNNKNVDADALIYTMATGRAHLSCRLMIKFDALEDLVEKLSLISTSEQPVGYEECVYKAPGESRLGDLLLPQDEVLEALASDFLEKGKAAWESYFGDLNLQVVPVPGYVFAPESCWVALPGGESKAKLTGQNRPTTSSEQVLVNALHHALGLTEVSYSDHFFEVGGNSIHALQLANELSEKLQLRITAQDIFEHPTVQELVTLINTKPAKGWDRIQAIESQTPSPISGVQRSMWLTWQMQPESTAYNLVNHFLIKGEFDLKRFKAAVKTVVERHEILRTRFEPSGEFAVQVVNESASFGWQLERSSVNVDATSWKRKLNESSWTKLDLTKGPLLNIALHELSDDHVGLSIE